MIQSIESKNWQFMDYAEGGKSQIEAWYERDLSERGRSVFDALLKQIQKIENPIHWISFKYLQGEPKKESIWQLDCRAELQYRVLGIFGPIRKQAILLIGCHHKGDKYTPANALKSALQRAKAVREGRAELHERQIRSDL